MHKLLFWHERLKMSKTSKWDSKSITSLFNCTRMTMPRTYIYPQTGRGISWTDMPARQVTWTSSGASFCRVCLTGKWRDRRRGTPPRPAGRSSGRSPRPCSQHALSLHNTSLIQWPFGKWKKNVRELKWTQIFMIMRKNILAISKFSKNEVYDKSETSDLYFYI